MPRPCHVLRVFTRQGEGGNALGVVNDYTALTDAGMQQIAAELGFSETVFVDWQPGAAPFVRIFTPAAELPFAGHPLVGTAWVFSELGPGIVESLRCGIGEVAIRTVDGATWIEVAAIGEVGPLEDADAVATAVGTGQPLRAWLVDLPLQYALLEVPDVATVAALAPAFDELQHFGTYVFARTANAVRARFFAPGHGVPEDPATGSAAVALAAALAHEGEVRGRVTIDQGEEMGHPSRIELTWEPGSVSIGGSVVRDEVRMLET